MADDGDKQSKWHVDKGIPLALICTLIGQGVFAIWWAAGINQRVTELERNASAAIPRLEAVIRLDTKVDMIQAGMSEIKAALTALATKQSSERR